MRYQFVLIGMVVVACGCSSTSTNQSSSTGGGGTGAAGTGAAGGAGGTSSSDAGVKRIFVTKTSVYVGGIVGGPDAFCSKTALAANLGGSWVAVLSTTSLGAIDRVPVNGPIINMHGEPVANDEADLWDGTLTSAISYDEHGDPRIGVEVWSGTLANGEKSADEACMGWMDQGNNTVMVGNSSAKDSGWIAQLPNFYCSQQAALYCLEL